MNIEEAIKNMEGIVVYIKMHDEKKSVLLSLPEDVKFEIDKTKGMLFVDMNPVLRSKIGIRLEKIFPMKWVGVMPERYFNVKDMEITPDTAFFADLEDRQITFLIQSREKPTQDMEKMKKDMHREIDVLLNPVNKET